MDFLWVQSHWDTQAGVVDPIPTLQFRLDHFPVRCISNPNDFGKPVENTTFSFTGWAPSSDLDRVAFQRTVGEGLVQNRLHGEGLDAVWDTIHQTSQAVNFTTTS